MASLTLNNIPEDLLESLRLAAERDRRSLPQQVIHLLEASLQEKPVSERVDVEAQVVAWRALAGAWQSDDDPETDSESILEARTRGREVEL
jgi:plasmid stability protein